MNFKGGRWGDGDNQCKHDAIIDVLSLYNVLQRESFHG